MNCYRGENKDYHIESSELVPSIYRDETLNKAINLKATTEYLNNIYDLYKEIPIFKITDYESDNSENTKTKKLFKRLGVMQHYGMKTPFIDVTESEKVAEYFACSGEFSCDGYIYSIDEKLYKQPDSKTVEGRMKAIWLKDFNVSNYLNVMKHNYCFDYREKFFSQADNIRYERQQGCFILHGYLLDDNNKIVQPIFPKVVKTRRTIAANKKIEELLKLAICDNITDAYLFPDKENNIAIVTEFEAMGTIVDKYKLNYLCNDKKWKELEDKLRTSLNGYIFLKTSLKDYYYHIKSDSSKVNGIAIKLLRILNDYK